MQIAMWSGPRNISTAMMYAFAARGDCAVWDEPFYAAYLVATGLEHPMRDEIIAAGETNMDRLVTRLTAAPEGKPHVYQKHMTQHMLNGFPRDWLRGCTNAFLIRHPMRVAASFTSKWDTKNPEEIGFRQQAELFDRVADWLGAAPPVIDSHDVRDDPEGALRALCRALGIAFVPAMLSWPAGGHPDEGVWAPVWYDAVHRSTGFAGAEGPLPSLTDAQARMADAVMPYYERLKPYALKPFAEPA